VSLFSPGCSSAVSVLEGRPGLAYLASVLVVFRLVALFLAKPGGSALVFLFVNVSLFLLSV
jgi:hypothetical protein